MARTIQDTITDKLAPVFRILSDLSVKLTGTECQIMRITLGEEDLLGQETETLEASVIDNVIISYPSADKRIHTTTDNTTEFINETNSFDLWDVLPIKMVIPFYGKDSSGTAEENYATDAVAIKEGDTILHIWEDENGNKIPIVMEVTQMFGNFMGRYLVGKRFTLTLLRGTPDVEMQALIDAYVASFNLDTVPEVSSIYPEDEATWLLTDSSVVLTFNTSMNVFLVEEALSFTPTITYTTSWDDAQEVLTITPTSGLTSNIDYTLTLNVEAESLFSKLPLAAEFTSIFKAPVIAVSSVYPVDGESWFSVNQDIVLTFNTSMNKTLSEGALSFSPSFAYTTSWDVAQEVLTITPDSSLSLTTDYVLTLTTNAASLSGGVFLTSEFTSSFKTQEVATYVYETTPVSGATTYNPTDDIYIIFWSLMNSIGDVGAFISVAFSSPPSNPNYSVGVGAIGASGAIPQLHSNYVIHWEDPTALYGITITVTLDSSTYSNGHVLDTIGEDYVFSFTAIEAP